MASKIHLGLIPGKSKRRAGCWSTQSNETALLGSSECKIYCRRIVYLNRRRNQRSCISKPVIASLEDARDVIVSSNWKCCPVGLAAFTSATKVLLKEYCKLQPGFLSSVHRPLYRGGAPMRHQFDPAFPSDRPVSVESLEHQAADSVAQFFWTLEVQ